MYQNAPNNQAKGQPNTNYPNVSTPFNEPNQGYAQAPPIQNRGPAPGRPAPQSAAYQLWGSMPVAHTCPHCGFRGLTVVQEYWPDKVLWIILLICFFPWSLICFFACYPIKYQHHCANCRALVGTSS